MQRQEKTVYEQIDDDQHYQQSEKNQNQRSNQSEQRIQNNSPSYLRNQQKHDQYEQKEYDQTEHENYYQKSKSQTKISKQSVVIDQQELGKYADLQQDSQDGQNIKISITKSQKKGSLMSYYYVYTIEGSDSRGNFSVPRRFNEFYQMRVAIVARWPGCFVPSIPAKNALAKNDASIIKKRTRYLNDFVKKIAKLPHLYYGEEFQTLLRSDEADISDIFSKWPSPTSQSIINKYKTNFSMLAGKELNHQTNEKINQFSQLIKKNESQLSKERQAIRALAESHDKLINSYGNLFTYVLPNYEKQCYSKYCDNVQSDMLYLNEQQIKLQQHSTIAKQATSVNAFWLLYDMMRHEQRDAMAFSEVIESRSKYEQKKHSIEIKISQNQKNIAELSMGKKPFSTLTTKGTNEEIKFKLSQEIEELKKQKENALIIIDIISAIIAYIEIERYKLQKKQFYVKALSRIGSSQITSVQNLAEIWHGLLESTENKLNKST